MLKLNQLMLAAGLAGALWISTTEVMAQNDQSGGRQSRGTNQGGARTNRANFDPAQFQQRLMERYRERLEIADDSEWKAIQPLLQKVLDARTAVGIGGRGNRPGGSRNQPDQTQRRSNPAGEALQRAVDSKASPAEVKAAVAKYLETRKAKQADLEKAQADFRAVLTARQEAIAVLSGLL